MEILNTAGSKKRILFVGEGNFSFSRHLTENWDLKSLDILATCHEPKPISEFALENIRNLEANGIRTKLNFDATSMESSDENFEEFDLIIFMFPHIGGKMKIDKNRDLLKQFGISASKILKNTSSANVIITLCDGQGGTPFDKIQRKEADSWQIVKMMSYGHWGLVQVDRFSLDLFPNYKSFGYRSQDKSFHTDQGTIHVFAKYPTECNKFLYSPVSKHDLSFWLPKSSDLCEKCQLNEIIQEVSNGLVTDLEIIDCFYNEVKDLHSQTIRLTYFSDEKVLSPDDIMTLHYKIGHILSEKINITVR